MKKPSCFRAGLSALGFQRTLVAQRLMQVAGPDPGIRRLRHMVNLVDGVTKRLEAAMFTLRIRLRIHLHRGAVRVQGIYLRFIQVLPFFPALYPAA